MAGRFTARRVAAPELAGVEEPRRPRSRASPGRCFRKPAGPAPAPKPPASRTSANPLHSDKLLDAKVRLHRRLIEEINLSALEKLPEDEIRSHVQQLVAQYVLVERLALNAQELNEFVSEILDEMTGLGPLEPLLKDPTISDILINGHECVYVERARHARAAARCASRTSSICCASSTRSSRRSAAASMKSHPLCDARLLDGSRVNVAVRPIGVDGPLVSIRKFSKKPLNLNKLVEVGALRPQMAELLGGGGEGAHHHDHLRRHRLRQDHDAQRAVRLHLGEGAPDHHRGRRRIAVAAAACRPHGDAPAQHRRQGRNPPARTGQERAAHAARPHHPRRVPRRGSLRHAAGDEHRPRRLDGDHPRQYAARRHLAPRADDRHGRPADDGRLDPRPDRQRHPAHRAAVAPVRRQAQGHLASPRSPGWKATSSRCRKSSSTCAPAPAPTARCRAISRPPACARASSPISANPGHQAFRGNYFDPSQPLCNDRHVQFRPDLSDLSAGRRSRRRCSRKASICCSTTRRPTARTSTAASR